MSRFVTYSELPSFPPEDQFGPGTVREKIGDLWIDHIDGKPTDAEIAERFVVTKPRDILAELDALKSTLK